MWYRKGEITSSSFSRQGILYIYMYIPNRRRRCNRHKLLLDDWSVYIVRYNIRYYIGVHRAVRGFRYNTITIYTAFYLGAARYHNDLIIYKIIIISDPHRDFGPFFLNYFILIIITIWLFQRDSACFMSAYPKQTHATHHTAGPTNERNKKLINTTTMLLCHRR